jgi:hypothetical protein
MFRQASLSTYTNQKLNNLPKPYKGKLARNSNPLLRNLFRVFYTLAAKSTFKLHQARVV